MNSEETTRAVTGRRIQMTVMTFHRELESGAVFHISPTRFHVRIRKKKGEGASACAGAFSSSLLTAALRDTHATSALLL